jgi:hypothetical protein
MQRILRQQPSNLELKGDRERSQALGYHQSFVLNGRNADGLCRRTRGCIASKVALAALGAPRIVPLDQNYQVAPLDVLTAKVFKQPNLAGAYPVDLDGEVSVPPI